MKGRGRNTHNRKLTDILHTAAEARFLLQNSYLTKGTTYLLFVAFADVFEDISKSWPAEKNSCASISPTNWKADYPSRQSEHLAQANLGRSYKI